jgi:hypothetical protein
MSTTTSTTLSLKAGIPPKLLLGGNRIDRFEIYRGVGVDPDLENDTPHHTSPQFLEGEFPADFDDKNVDPGQTYHYVVKLIRSSDNTFSTSRVFKITASGAYDLGYPNNFPAPDSGVPFFTLVEPILHLRADVEIGRKGEGFVYTAQDILTNEADSWQSLNYNFTGFQLKYWRTFGDALRMENNLAGQYTDWSSGSSYSSGDKVGYDYIAYKAKEDITSSTTPPPEDPDNWTQFSSSIETNIPVFTYYNEGQQEISSTDLDTLGHRRLNNSLDYSFFPGNKISMYGDLHGNPSYKLNYDDFVNYFKDKNESNSVSPSAPLEDLSVQHLKRQQFVLDEGVTYFAVFPNRGSVSTYKPRYKISELLSDNYSGTTNVMATGKVYAGANTYDDVSDRVLNYYFDFTGVFEPFTSYLDAYRRGTGYFIIIYHEDGFHEVLPLQSGLYEEPLLNNNKVPGYLFSDVHGQMNRFRLGTNSFVNSAMTSQPAYDNHPNNTKYNYTKIPNLGKYYYELTSSDKAERRRNTRLDAKTFPNPAGGFRHLPDWRYEGLHAAPPSGGLYYELIAVRVQNLNKPPNYVGATGKKSVFSISDFRYTDLDNASDVESFTKKWSDGDPWENPNPPFGALDPSRPHFYCPIKTDSDSKDRNFDSVYISPGLSQSTGVGSFTLGGHQGIDGVSIYKHGPGYIENTGQPFGKFNKDYKVSNNKLNVLVYTYDPNGNSGKGKESIFINGSLIFQNDSTAVFDMGEDNYWKSQGLTESNFIGFNRPPIFNPESSLNLSGTESFCELINYHKFLDRADFNRVIYYIKAKYGEDGFLSTQSNYNGLY